MIDVAGKPKMRLVEKRNLELAKMAERLKYLEKIQDEFVSSESSFYELTEMLLEKELKFSALDMSALSVLILDNVDSLRKEKDKKSVTREESSPNVVSNIPIEDTYSVGI